MKNSSTKVKIFNSDYNLLGDNPAEVERLASFVDNTMKKISYQSQTSSVESIAVVSALNIAESFFKEKDYRKDIERELITVLQDSAGRIDELTRIIDQKL